ncbi:two-component system activity regulator YycH [Sporosarcina oncorhynchi]|uniref:Two-component system activity regulator YycH n=1 Tax=Sporosarcina oncorhynchi TaxID=3056444 RepID=A0ABZ0L5N9_9BACL|nr:two-component system activity regulator YycH [Sporosarcina sp. T2O-4]WOV87542.1 two-component system activity regulator YycH [Sporosarcina sp. T2O-4]
MGLKYIEPIKSIVLLLLVLLSITFTLSIWTYTPRLDPIEQSPTVDISIGQRKNVKEIIKPYKFMIKNDEFMRGTTEQLDIDQIVNEMATWKITQLLRNPVEMNKKQMNEFFRQQNQFTLYFQGDVPLSVYDEILEIEEVNIPQFSFDRLVVKWNPKDISFEVHFLNRASGIHYYGRVTPIDTMKSYRSLVVGSEAYKNYAEVLQPDGTYLAVSNESLTIQKLTYFQEELSPTRFRDALFNDPNAVRRSQVDATHEEFGDDHASMIVDTDLKMLNFVHPAAETSESIKPSELLIDVIDSINEHGGWTNTYRFSHINPSYRYVKFQLFTEGYPVHSNAKETTEIAQFYGDDRVFRYIRPYYMLDDPLSEEVELPSGVSVANALMNSDQLDFGTVEEISVGYMMRHDPEQRVYVMEPSWFYLVKGNKNWKQYTPEQDGGEQYGLE